jgi:hypothetical protein
MVIAGEYLDNIERKDQPGIHPWVHEGTTKILLIE